jgi:hypothetical protein
MAIKSGVATLCCFCPQSMRNQGNVREMMFALRTDLIRNIANIAKR